MKAAGQKLLVYEPLAQGHHLSWLAYITEDLLSGGFRPVLALDQRRDSRALLEQHLGTLLSEVEIVAARTETGWICGDGDMNTVAGCMQLAGARQAFLCCFDEIASRTLRRAGVGVLPPETLRGAFGGIYMRPYFLNRRGWSPNSILKKAGFRRLLRGRWFHQLLLLDEYLTEAFKTSFPNAPFHFLPDTCPEFNGPTQIEARKKLGLPEDRRIFLFYGGPYKRKGLHYAVQAMQKLPAGTRAFLLCLGQQPKDPETTQALESLVETGRAYSLNRYISTEEETLGFAACDAVLLPYFKHQGSSGVLSRASAAGKPVIGSDEELLGRRIREHGLGLLFPSGDVDALSSRLSEWAEMNSEQFAKWSGSARVYAKTCSRQAFRSALLNSFADPQSSANHSA